MFRVITHTLIARVAQGEKSAYSQNTDMGANQPYHDGNIPRFVSGASKISKVSPGWSGNPQDYSNFFFLYD